MQSILTQRHVQTRSATPPPCALCGRLALHDRAQRARVSLGAIVRNTAGGIATFVGLLFVLPGMSAILPTSTQNAINPYLPLRRRLGAPSDTRDAYTFSLWGGFALFCGYTVLALAAGA